MSRYVPADPDSGLSRPDAIGSLMTFDNLQEPKKDGPGICAKLVSIFCY